MCQSLDKKKVKDVSSWLQCGHLRSKSGCSGMIAIIDSWSPRYQTLRMACTWVLLTAFCLAVYWNALYCGFVFDDISAIKENKDLRPHTPLRNLFDNDFWGTPIIKEQSHKSYRPLCVLTFRWNYWIHQLEPWGYHLANILLHAAVTCLFSRMCSLFMKPTITFVAALLFAVHPIHTEAVTGVVGRAELLSSLFSLAAFLLYTRCRVKSTTDWPLFAAVIGLICISMLCKEQGISVIGICIVYELFVLQKVRLRDFMPSSSKTQSSSAWIKDSGTRLMALVASTIGLLLLRMQVMGAQLPVFTRFDNPASVSATPTRQLTYNYLVSWNAWLLTFPGPLCCDWTMGTIPLVETLSDPRNLGTVMLYVTLALMSTRALVSLEPVLIMGLAWLALPFLPASNFFFPVGFVIAERILYTPSMGFCMLVAYGFSKLEENRKYKFLVRSAFVFTLLVFAAKTHIRNWDWRTEESVFASGLRVNQRNAKLFNNVGHALESQKRYDEALEYFVEAVRVQEDDIGAHINVGRTYTNLGLLQEAEDAYLKAKSLLPRAKPGETYQTRIAPNHLNVFLNLAGLVARNATRLSEADALYRQAISMRADYTQAYINRGDVLLKMNRTKEAQEVYEKALFYDSNNPDIYYNLGVVLLEQDKPGQALAYFEKALELEPEHQAALLNSGIILQELASVATVPSDAPEDQITSVRRETVLRRQEAQLRLMKLLTLDQKNERAFFHLGMIATDLGDITGSERWFRAAIELKPDFRSALFNLALLLADHGRPLEAAPFLRQLVRHHPDHVKGLVLLGDIYVNTLRDLDAAEMSYLRILEIDPENVQGLHNLCVVHVERGHLQEAEKCLEKARNLAPQEEYISRHLSIVRERLARHPKTSDEPVRT